MPSPTLLFTSDLHADASRYAELVERVESTRPRIVLLGGDLFAGDPREQERFARGPFEEMLTAVHEHGVTGVGLVPGNDDWSAPFEALRDFEIPDFLHFVHERPWEAAPGVHIVGYGFTPLTPFSVKDHEKLDHYRPDKMEALEGQAGGVASSPEVGVAAVRRALDGTESIEKDLATLNERVRRGRSVFLSHCPPRNTQLDLAYGRHAGSQALRDFLERTQPAISLHGHVAEVEQRQGRFAEWLGDTLVVNPGQGAPLHAVLFDADCPADSLVHTVLGAWHDERDATPASAGPKPSQFPRA